MMYGFPTLNPDICAGPAEGTGAMCDPTWGGHGRKHTAPQRTVPDSTWGCDNEGGERRKPLLTGRGATNITLESAAEQITDDYVYFAACSLTANPPAHDRRRVSRPGDEANTSDIGHETE